MPSTVAMGDPAHFSVIGGANPHTRDWLGRRKRVDPELARRQWHSLARALINHGVEVCVIEPHPELSGLVYPANAGFLYPPAIRPEEGGSSPQTKAFYLSNLLPTRAPEREVYRCFLNAAGYETRALSARFEGEADFFPAGRFMVFTHGTVRRQHFVPRLGLPPWRRVYGFRSEAKALDELGKIAADRPTLALELCLETHYHGDTVLCSFGARREFLLAYLPGITPRSRDVLRSEFGSRLVELSERDGELYAANSFQSDFEGHPCLFMPEGISARLADEIRERGVTPVTVDVSEFLSKGGGAVKCMILDLGPRDEQPEAGASFRAERAYQRLFGGSTPEP